RGALLDDSGEFRGGGLYFAERENGRIGQFHDFAFDVFGRTPPAQEKRAGIAFGHALHVFDQSRRSPQAEYEYAAGQSVERSGVAYFRSSRQTADDVNRAARGHAA